MASPLRLTLPLPPTTNRLYRVVNNHAVKSAEARAYEESVAQHVADLGIADAGGLLPPYALVIDLFLKHDRDVDSCKALQDAVSRALGFDDRLIVRLVVEKHQDKRNPRCEIALSEIEGAARQPRLLGLSSAPRR
jgi:Holliday junction resolvase RusA-like endonuclease